jgi:hypothetical protein
MAVPRVAWFAFLLSVLALVVACAAAPAARQDSLSLRQGREALWRSVALDGWGQAHNGEWLKAALFSGAELAIVAGAVGQHRQWKRWADRRDKATDAAQLEFYTTRADFYLKDRNKILWWWLWLKLGSSLDAYVSGSLSNFDAGWESSWRLEPTRLDNGSAALRVTWLIP